VLGSCGCALAVLVGCPLAVKFSDVAPRQLALGLALLFLVGALITAVRRRPEAAGTWKCESCGEPNPESAAGCAACGKRRA
jgi:hypothetical protein